MSPNDQILNPNEDLYIPPWINADYFKDILAENEPDMVEVKKFTATAAIPPGENFTSAMLRIHMDLEMKDNSIKRKTYILKTMLEDDKGGDMVNKLSLFPKELQMYGKYLPAFEKLYQSAGCNIQLGPKCLFTEQKNGRINFVFEDLKMRNFTNLDRLIGCDMKHMKRILSKLAEFHAASAVYEEQNGVYPEDFQYGFVDSRLGPDFLKQIFRAKSDNFITAMKQWDLENGQEFIEKFPNFEQFWASALATLQQDTNKFNVLTHGDFWSSNIMLSYLANGDLDKVLLVDFQICKWGSPAEDLLFFLTISPISDIRIKEFDHFVAIYHKRLIECLTLLGYKKAMPSLRDLHMDMYDKKNSFYAFFACFNHLPVIMLPTDKDSNIKTLSSDTEEGEKFRMRVLTNPRFVNAMKDLFPFYHNRGIFNFQDYAPCKLRKSPELKI